MADRAEQGAEQADDGFTVEEVSETTREVSLGSLSVTLRKYSGRNIQIDTGQRASGGRWSTGADEWGEAIEQAKDWLQAEVDRRRGLKEATETAENRPREVTLRQLVAVYRRDKWEELTEKEQVNMELVIDLVDEIWGLETRAAAVDRPKVDEFIQIRVEEGVTFSHCDRPNLPTIKPVTALQNLRDFNRITQHAATVRLDDGTPLLRENPFNRIKWPSGSEFEKEHQDPIPDEVHLRLLKPWTDPRTGHVLPAPVDRIDPSGLLRCLLMVAYLTGHRSRSICNLRVGDLLFEKREIRQRLHTCGKPHLPDWADAFAEHGAIYWSPELDKQSYERVTPISRHLRPHLDAYLETLPSRKPDAPLFPSPKDSDRPIGKSTLFRVRGRREVDENNPWKLRKGGWFTEAVYLLRGQLALEGEDPDELIPLEVDDSGKSNLPWKLHGYRSLYASRLDRLGYGQRQVGKDKIDLNRHGDFLGGWSILGRGVKQERYVELDGELLKAAADLVPSEEAMAARGRSEADRTVETLVQIEPGGSGVSRTGPEGSTHDTEPGGGVTLQDADEGEK